MPPAPAWYQLVRGCRRAAAGHKFVAVRVSEDVPAPPVFDHGVIGEQGRAQAGDPLDLPFQAGGAQVQMQPVLAALVIAGALQEYLDAVAVCGDQAPGTASCSRRALRHRERQHAFPLGQSVRLAGS
jgi:hypothetical protein